MIDPTAPELAGRTRPASSGAGAHFDRSDLLRWIYLGRLTLVTGILAAAIPLWLEVRPEDTLAATVLFVVAAVVTAGSFWYTHILERQPGQNFLYGQVILDAVLVTGIVHLTGGPESNFAPVYILVISAGALLLPLPGGVLIGGLASAIYSADLVWGHQAVFGMNVALQIGLFTVVALVTGLVADRLRRAGVALGAVESELRQLRLDTGDILGSLSTGVVTVDGDGRLAYANSSAEMMLGIAAPDWLGRPVVDEFERLAPGLGAALSLALRDGTMVERVRATAHKNGRELSLGISTTILDRGEGQPPSATAIFQDITDLERLEALDRRTERLQAVATLSASLAHEIKNPLASIRSAVEQITRRTLSGDDRATLERLVLTESDRLSRLLSEFLDYSGLELGQREPVDAADVVRHCVEVARQHPDLAGVELRVEVLEEPVRLFGNADLLHRALFNLVLNGAQASGPGGRIVVELGTTRRRVGRSGRGSDREIRIAVSDSGPGIDHESSGRIFDPFYTTKEGGSGLGLAMVHRAVEAHGGAVLVERASAGGARFVILLPEGLGRDGGPARG